MADGKNNLIPFTKSSLSKEEVREINRRGGINSGKARLHKKRGRELMRELLSMKEIDPETAAKFAEAWGLDPAKVTKEMEMNMAQIERAVKKGDPISFKEVHRVAGTFEDDEKTGTTINIVVSDKSAQAAKKWSNE